MNNASLTIRDLDIVLGGTPIIEGLDLAIAPGEFIVLLGPSGCGKSTLLHSIAGLIDVHDGVIDIGGRDVTWAEPSERGIGMVFQSYALYPTMTVEKNMSFGLRINGVDRAEIQRRVQHTAQMLQLQPLLQRKPAQLSGGQRQRVAIGRALVREAGVYLFDEPLSNLDAKLRAELRRELKQLHQRLGATMVYVTHDQVEAMTLATRLVVMRAGRIQQVGTPAEVYQRPANRFVAGFLGSPGMNFVPGRLQRQAGGWRLQAEAFALTLGEGLDAATEPTTEPTPELSTDHVTDGQAVVLGLRPEHLEVALPGAASLAQRPGLQAMGEAVVELVEPLGALCVLWLNQGGQRLSVQVGADCAWAPGQVLGLWAEVSRLSVFDAASEARL